MVEDMVGDMEIVNMVAEVCKKMLRKWLGTGGTRHKAGDWEEIEIFFGDGGWGHSLPEGKPKICLSSSTRSAQCPQKVHSSQVVPETTVDFDFVSGDTILYCEVRLCVTRYVSVPRDTILYYEIRFFITRDASELRDTILYYWVRFWTTRYDSVLRDTILYHEKRFCITR